jgi:hypothetical protein
LSLSSLRNCDYLYDGDCRYDCDKQATIPVANDKHGLPLDNKNE